MGGHPDIHVFPKESMNAPVYRDDIFDVYVRSYAGTIGDTFLLQDNNTRSYRARIIDDYLQQENYMLMEWSGQSPKLNPIECYRDALGRIPAALNPPPQTLVVLSTALQKLWLSLPMELIDRIIESITHHCMCCIASQIDNIPY